jgi:proteasome beta subunit
LDLATGTRAAVEALYDASQEDVATGGPNPIRGIFPSVRTITADGVNPVADDDVRAAFEAIVGESGEASKEHGGSGARETQDGA